MPYTILQAECASADGAQLLRRSVGDAVQDTAATAVSYYLDVLRTCCTRYRILYLVVYVDS